MMQVFRFREIEQTLEDTMDVGGSEKIFAAGDVGDLLEGIVDDDGKVVGSSDVLSRQDDVS